MAFEYRDTLAAFAAVMAEKLEENQHKGHWEDCSNHWLLSRLLEETAELVCAMNMIGAIDGKLEWREHVAREAADIANFAMMIADNVKNGLTK